MNRMPKWLLAGFVSATFIGGLAGCSDDKIKPLTLDQFIGTWLEIPQDPALQSNRVVKVERLSPKLRKVTFNADGTFKLELAEPDGTVADASKSLSGKFKFEESVIICEDVKNTLGKKFDAWRPNGAGAVLPPKLSGTSDTTFTISHEDGGVANYKKM